MTTTKTPAATSAKARKSRARAERPPRCERPKVENGRPCKRGAGAGTDHVGVGPCSLHDDGSWERPALAVNVEVRAAFLAAVTESPLKGIRDLIEPLGYHRRDVTSLLDSDPVFEEDYIEARGYDLDSIRNELRKRAFEGGSDRLLELEAKMRLPEGQALLSRMRVDANVQVSAAPFIDISKLTLDELEQLRGLLAKARPEPGVLGPDQRPALELLPGGDAA